MEVQPQPLCNTARNKQMFKGFPPFRKTYIIILISSAQFYEETSLQQGICSKFCTETHDFWCQRLLQNSNWEISQDLKTHDRVIRFVERIWVECNLWRKTQTLLPRMSIECRGKMPDRRSILDQVTQSLSYWAVKMLSLIQSIIHSMLLVDSILIQCQSEFRREFMYYITCSPPPPNVIGSLEKGVMTLYFLK